MLCLLASDSPISLLDKETQALPEGKLMPYFIFSNNVILEVLNSDVVLQDWLSSRLHGEVLTTVEFSQIRSASLKAPVSDLSKENMWTPVRSKHMMTTLWCGRWCNYNFRCILHMAAAFFFLHYSTTICSPPGFWEWSAESFCGWQRHLWELDVLGKMRSVSRGAESDHSAGSGSDLLWSL